MSYEVLQILVLALGLTFLGVALIVVAMQISKMQTGLETLESDFVKAFENKPLLTEEEQNKQQVTYKEAIKRLRSGQSPREISKETGVSRRELKALSNILDAL